MNNKKFWRSLLAGLLAAILLLSLLMSLLPTFVRAAQASDTIKEQIAQMEKENQQTQEEVEEIRNRLEQLKKDQSSNRSEIAVIIQEKNLIDQEVGLLYTQLTNMNEQIAAYNVLIADKQEEVEAAEKRLNQLNDLYKARIRAMEEDGNISYWSVLLEANSFFDLLDRLNMVQEIAVADTRRLEQLRQAAAEVEAARAELLQERAALSEAKAELEAARTEFMLKGAASQELLSQLTAKMEELKDQEGDYKDTMSKLEDELEELEISIGQAQIELDKALYEEYLATLTTAPPPTTAPTQPSYSGGGTFGGNTTVDESGIVWVVPCTYSRVSSAFGWRIHPVYKDWRHHNGVDLSAKCKMKKDGTTDSPIYATRAGVVVISKWSDSAGWYVTIDHLDGYRSTYMHMCCKPFVQVGDVVAAGQVIGCIGTTGTSTGDHLHFGIYKDGDPVNPMEYIG